MKKWILRGCKISAEEIAKISAITGLPNSIIQILAVRGFTNADNIKDYLSTSLDFLHHPGLLKDMDKAIDILLDAIDNGIKIAVYGDYDADGITATSILTMALRRLGGDVLFYIPQRETEGYGLNDSAIRELANQGVKVLLTCDNGISAVNQIAFAKKLGMTVIISDHHEIPFIKHDTKIQYQVPVADAIINPKQLDCPYPFKALCGASIAYKIVEGLYITIGEDWEEHYLEYLSLAVIATVCDIMDLVDENRVMVKFGLSVLQNTPNIGLKALIEANGLKDKKLTTYHLGFVLGPCINASGRLELADKAVNLFLETDSEKAKVLAEELIELNNSRKFLTVEGVELVRANIEANDMAADKVIVVYEPNLHENIAGIVAGRIKELYYRPTFILSGDKPIVRGSGRSIEAYNMFEALTEVSNLLDIFGGHPMAAGLSVPKHNIDALRKALNENCKLTQGDMVQNKYIDLHMPLERVNLAFANAVQKMEPFGKGNPMPLFGDKALNVNRIQLLGNEENVLRIYFDAKNSKGMIPVILFRQKAAFKDMVKKIGNERLWHSLVTESNNKLLLDIIYTVETANYNNNTYLQIQLKDFRPHINTANK
ncbi:MAG: single-stranded-DNA-specific exonuclease RecJ [Clostridia bacterium]|nr:single-stranded-DNA-specific exonuclease RecJ [Clostridia bacterium]MDD4571402.1 single-stranded-DNA-specific exonuclease RecJ [Clostridia bacterium]